MAFPICVLFLLCGISGLLAQPWPRRGGPCPEGWTQLNDHCYIYQDYPRTFADSQRVCTVLHANLVSISSRVENAIVLQMIRDTNNGDIIDTWTGLHDTIEENHFIWTDGTPLVFDDFARGDPNSLGGNEDCVDIEGDDALWHDNPCEDENPFICIRDVKAERKH
ncbi:alpha-N-acetylgalactosamine-specific lectin-like [Dunckerocampus dactyliophorus]|uniref:alpha-N-acetylgalactosamine-specific lectin-like n=1 Tax=Dunckerocampus dactyliophorus TaxID=161453 RepID=UPI00240636C3|nr:alpha-N-acetylgalactosamine-specific lectin-like [Dunckerocampus dactyliophorus]